MSQPLSSLVRAGFSVVKSFPALPIISLENEALAHGLFLPFPYVFPTALGGAVRAVSAGEVAAKPREQLRDPRDFLKRAGGLLGTDIVTCTPATGPPCWPMTGIRPRRPCLQPRTVLDVNVAAEGHHFTLETWARGYLMPVVGGSGGVAGDASSCFKLTAKLATVKLHSNPRVTRAHTWGCL